MAGSRRLTDLSEAVLARVGEHLPEGRLVVALSGGADSAVCAWAAVRLGAEVRTVHVDHGWPASAGLRRAAQAVAANVEVDFLAVSTHPHPGPSAEGPARTVRYAALENELDEDEWLLTGHTMDDHAETVLGNLVRGAGSAGLSGIPRRRGRIVRPLLDVSRTETRELAALLGLPWTDDPTNLDGSLRRNALRRDLIPYVESHFNPSFRLALIRLASSLAVDEEYLENAARTVPLEIGPTSVRLPAARLATAARPVAARAVRRALRAVRDDGYPGSAAQVEAILLVAGGGPPSELEGSIRVERDGPWLTLRKTEEVEVPAARDWVLPGKARFGSWTFEAWMEEVAPQVFPLSGFAEVFDADHLPDVAVVRTARPGDGIAIVGGTKPLSDVFGEARVAASERPRWPVVAAAGAVIWVPGVRRADAGWVGKATTRYLWVRAELEETS